MRLAYGFADMDQMSTDEQDQPAREESQQLLSDEIPPPVANKAGIERRYYIAFFMIGTNILGRLQPLSLTLPIKVSLFWLHTLCS